jgi:hypothetical protein
MAPSPCPDCVASALGLHSSPWPSSLSRTVPISPNTASSPLRSDYPPRHNCHLNSTLDRGDAGRALHVWSLGRLGDRASRGSGSTSVDASVAAHLRHANAAVTQTIYAHRLTGADAVVAASIGRLFEEPGRGGVAIQELVAVVAFFLGLEQKSTPYGENPGNCATTATCATHWMGVLATPVLDAGVGCAGCSPVPTTHGAHSLTALTHSHRSLAGQCFLE